jgi:hypothetical protein
MRARSYVYVTSAVLSNQSVREDLGRDVAAFFAKIRTAGQAQIEQTVVLDWSDLRPFFDGLPRLSDRWLGVGLTALLGHDEHVAALTGIRSQPNELTFIPPPTGREVHPDRLLSLVLERAQMGGVLLIGPNGVGKTRALLEVASRADAQGWRVVHAVAGHPALAVEEPENLLHGPADTLVVCDDLEQFQFNVGSLVRRLLPEIALRGKRLAILASARSSREALRAPESFFAIVRLRANSRQKNLIRAAREAQCTTGYNLPTSMTMPTSDPRTDPDQLLDHLACWVLQHTTAPRVVLKRIERLQRDVRDLKHSIKK